MSVEISKQIMNRYGEQCVKPGKCIFNQGTYCSHPAHMVMKILPIQIRKICQNKKSDYR